MSVRQLASALMLALASTTAFAQTGTQQPPAQARRTTRLRRASRRHGVEGRAAARQRAGDGLGRDLGRDRVDAGHQLRRAVPGGARREHLADVGARLQHHDARRDVDAGHVDAGAARRPQPVPGFLRLRRLGSAAGESERAEADRSDSRAGVRRVGRQRDERRHQLHLEDAARAERQQRDADVRHVRPRHRRRPAARQRHAVRHQRDACARHQRSLGLQDLGRRLHLGPLRAPDRRRFRTAPARSTRTSRTGHDAAEVRHARRLRRREVQAGVRGRLFRHRRHLPHRHRAVRRRRRRRRLRHDALLARRR